MENRPTTITAAEWGKVAEDVKLKQCSVLDRYEAEVTDIRIYEDWVYYDAIRGNGFVGTIQGRHSDTFTVRWLTENPPATASATAEAVSDGVALARAQIARLQSALKTIRDYPTVEADMELGHQVAGMAMQAEVALEEVPANSGLLTVLADKLEAQQSRITALQAELDAARNREARLREALVTSITFFQEAADYAEVEYNKDDATIYIIAEAGKKCAAEALAAADDSDV